ncbi:DNA ligase [Sinimarinibacterium sp. CAU 1509]|nr:DNA ligase [Sinimarinibacterium sp. CAU 1509]
MRTCALSALLSLLLVSCPATAEEAARTTPPALMLAKRYAGDIDLGAYWVSEKLDGVRGYWDGTALWTRGGSRVRTPAWFTAGWPTQPLDGELWIGRGRFAELSGIVRTQTPDDDAWRQVHYMVFDLPHAPGTFDQRLQILNRLIADNSNAWLRAVEQFRIDTPTALDARLRAVVAAGGEGLMLHRGDSRYQARRSDDLLKLKPFDDDEARVVGYQAGNGKYAGQVGSLIVERVDGLRFELGSGLSDAERAQPPPLGSWVTYRYNGLTVNGLPRFARYLRLREELPPPDPP